MGGHSFTRDQKSSGGNGRPRRDSDSAAFRSCGPPHDGGKLIVLTAPLTETIDHAGYFIQMALASMPKRMEAAIDQKYPKWREVERNPDGSARYMPAGVRVLEASLLREFPAEDVGCCYPDDLSQFIGPRTRVVGVSTHNPLGVTFAAGVYASVFGSSREPINAHYAKQLFRALRENRYRSTFQVIVGGSGGWQIPQTDSYQDLGVDCVVEGRSESEQTLELFHQAIRGEALPRFVEVRHPKTREELLTPARRTTFGVVEMTTGCGRRCQFCLPDLNPQIDFPKDNRWFRSFPATISRTPSKSPTTSSTACRSALYTKDVQQSLRRPVSATSRPGSPI